MNSKKVAETLGVSIDTLRYYERVGVIPPVKRDKNGYRDYRDRDLNWIFLAKSLKNAGMSVESMIEFASLAQMRDEQDVSAAQKEVLNEQLDQIDEKLAELEKTRDLLKYKITTYDNHLAKFRSGEMNDDNVEKLWIKDSFKVDKGDK
ncbi:MerR family transcriptional regulator [Lentilactobacillus kosonis]|uniref:Transcriptional regulator, MerR family n=1 Tax=Lentilactobacillus kosonis TaxID=2810561 RepID=A0A401FHM4_9LACO|nr:MerR family transcriptional regulator [Lentilactobacillus kosonis]GAY71860.1 transcriptional regulator, MerR family [Lentilactobacillus kosonis]